MTKKIDSGPTNFPIEINELSKKQTALGPPPFQTELFHVEKQIEIDGVEMGVLENGIPYLTESGLARMCGIDRKVLNRLAINWTEEKLKGRGSAINVMLVEAGYLESGLYLKSELNGSEVNAYTEPVCMALLEYYAFVTKEPRAEAIKAFRRLARETFRTLIYTAVGYSPEQKMLDSWRHFHDRMDMTVSSVPFGYFSVFKEIAVMIVPMIRAGVIISDRVVPDISVGKAWSEYWTVSGFEVAHGNRCKYNHEYPLYYPQAKSNPQPSFAYPDSALGTFRAWLIQHYLSNKFPTYLLGQTRKGNVTVAIANKAIDVFAGKRLEAQKTKSKAITKL